VGSFLKSVLCAAAFILLLPAPSEASDDHLGLSLVPAHETVAAGGDIVIGLKQVPDAGWHTYWLNPGDTGLATEIDWNLPSGLRADAIQWPVPQRLTYAGLVTYGYEGPSILVTHFHVPEGLAPGTHLPVKAHVGTLVCHDVCEPVTADLTVTLTVGAPVPGGGALTRAVDALPQPINLSARPQTAKGMVSLDFAAPSGTPPFSLSPASLKGLYFFSETEDLIAPGAPQVFTPLPSGFRLQVKAGDTSWPDKYTGGVLRLGNGQAYQIQVAAAPSAPVALPTAARLPFVGLLTALGLAFLGGLVLNLMPCVFPILSMKLLALIRAGHDKTMARHESFLYGVGAMLSFLALAGMLEVARHLGAALGWGFQMQSPLVTAALSLLLLLVGLNMSGLFEVGGRLQALAGNVSVGKLSVHPYASAFMTGVLAVVVAAPCTAPFMATAIGVALAQGGLVSLTIFAALGLGFALPFVLMAHILTVIPAVARFMPKPGPWMDRLRHALALPMYAAALWMIWVFAQQVSPVGLGILLMALFIIAFSLIRGRNHRWLAIAGASFGVVIGLAGALQTSTFSTAAATLATAPYEAFSIARLEALQSQGKPVLVDLTAAWCVTCKVNERTALSDARVLTAFRRTGTVYMVGDWTRQDAGITAYLRTFGRSGVPLYVYYEPGHKPVVLPQVLNAGRLASLLTGQVE
jgi:thiol:disulfide interchange protein DsbD